MSSKEKLVLCNFDLGNDLYNFPRKPYLFVTETESYSALHKSEYALVDTANGQKLAKVLAIIDLGDVYSEQQEPIKKALMITTGAKEPLKKVIKFYEPIGEADKYVE